MDDNAKRKTSTQTACGEQSRTEDKRGLECRHCGCKHFRVTCLPAGRSTPARLGAAESCAAASVGIAANE